MRRRRHKISAKVRLLDSIRNASEAAAIGKLSGTPAPAFEAKVRSGMEEARRQGWAKSAELAAAAGEREGRRHVTHGAYRW